MGNLISFVVFVLVGFLALAWLLQSSRMFLTFKTKYPELAAAEIPRAFSHIGHPEKFFFIFRKKLLPILKADPEIWRLRQQTVVLTLLLYVVFPILFIAFGVTLSLIAR